MSKMFFLCCFLSTGVFASGMNVSADMEMKHKDGEKMKKKMSSRNFKCENQESLYNCHKRYKKMKAKMMKAGK